MSSLLAILRDRAAQAGILSFAEFMNLALYCPKYGYYERSLTQTGRSGDFITNVSVSSLFGELLAFRFDRWLAELPPGPLQIVEAGAHDGQLAADILAGLRASCRWPQLEYWLVEPSDYRQQQQRDKLKEFAPRVRWFSSLAALPPSGVSGIIFANELLDAFPIHRLSWNRAEKKWNEWGVGWDEIKTEFVWLPLPAPALDLAAELALAGFSFAAEFTDALPDGFTLELAPAARRWWAEAAQSLRLGRLLTIDYGMSAEQFLHPSRARGTARGYYRHRLTDQLLAQPGDQDLTAHVNFTQLELAGASAGLSSAMQESQAQFLMRVFGETLQSPFPEWTQDRRRKLQTLTHPEHLGRAFQVFEQRRGSDQFSGRGPAVQEE